MASKGGDRIMELKTDRNYLDKLISVQDMEVIKVVTRNPALRQIQPAEIDDGTSAGTGRHGGTDPLDEL